VGRAYRDLSEFERAYLVFRATIDASFINDVNISAVLEDEGQFLGSIDYQEDLWREYPDASEVSSMYFSISQALYLNAARAHELAKQERNIAIMRGGKPVRQDVRKPEKIAMLRETIRLLVSFMTLNPENPLSDDAAFSMANALLDLKQFDLVISSCERFKQHFTDSEFASGYQYMTALGQFWKHNYAEALQAAATVAEGDRVAAAYLMRAVHDGVPIQIPGMFSFVITGGLITRRVDYFDSLTFLRQTGQA
jgi:tetratricopeptide (TPR) repeat protein